MMHIKNLNKSFGNLEVFRNFNININKGEVLCLLGPSGCGKSTLLKVIAGLQCYEGDINCVDLKISYVFQEPRLVPWMSVKENLKYVLDHQVDDVDERINHYLEAVELIDFKDALPSQLSGGMKQRISLARAFAVPHDILLLDEPFQGLDEALKDQLMTLLEKLIEQDSKTVVMVTHDINEAKRLGHRIIELKGKPISFAEEVVHEK